MKRIALVLSALGVVAGLAACGGNGQPSPSATTFADGQAYGSTATAKQIELGNPYARYPNIAVASFASTFCARMDPTPLSGNTDDPNTLNIGTQWFQGCVAAVRANAAKLGTTS